MKEGFEEFMEKPLEQLAILSPEARKEVRNEIRRRKIAQMHKQERNELLGNDKDEIIHQRKKQQQADALRAAESITESLTRTKILLERELERSGKTLEKLVESNKVIAGTLEEQHLYKDETNQAKNIRSKMKRREFSDVFFITAFLLLYVFVILFILFRRFSFLFSWMFFWL